MPRPLTFPISVSSVNCRHVSVLCVNFLPSRVLCHVIRDERDILHDISWQWPPFRCGVQEASTPSSSHLNHVSCNSVWANIELGAGVWCNVLRTVSNIIFRSGPAKTTSSRVKILLLLCISFSRWCKYPQCKNPAPEHYFRWYFAAVFMHHAYFTADTRFSILQQPPALVVWHLISVIWRDLRISAIQSFVHICYNCRQDALSS